MGQPRGQMRRRVAALFLTGALSPVPAAVAATMPQSETWDAKGESGAAAATHATRGVVQAIDSATLVIVRFGHRGEMTFCLSPSMKLEGTIVVGSTISVRYREDGARHIATAIALQRSKD